MKEGYFHRVNQQTPTQFWINNPTRAEAAEAIDAGATGCTCNPSYCQKMIDHPEEGAYALAILDDAIKTSRDASEAEATLQRKLVKAIADMFATLFEASKGHQGYVSIQGDPIREHDPNVIVQEARLNHEVAPNACIKVPTTRAGLMAMEPLIADGYAINATEIFGVAQAISLCELYARVTKHSSKRPIMYLSHIAGIYDDFLRQYVEHEGIDISRDVLWQAGLAVARRVYQIIHERGYQVTFISGGARGLHHFTEMVGGDVMVTINWVGTADRLLETDPPVVSRLFNPVPQKVIDELMDKLPDFRRGYLEDGLSLDEYESFGPVVLFRDGFCKSWTRVLDLARERGKGMGGFLEIPK